MSKEVWERDSDRVEVDVKGNRPEVYSAIESRLWILGTSSSSTTVKSLPPFRSSIARRARTESLR